MKNSKRTKRTKHNEKIIAVADCETDPFDGVTIPEPFIWGFYDGNNYEEFTDTGKFIEYCLTLPPTILYAHNGGKFDWMFILDYIDDFERVMIINGRLSKFTIGDVEFRDSMNILPVSLKKMQKDNFDYNKMKRDVRDQHMTEIKKYLYHDCIYLHRYILLFIEQYGLHLTQAGCAMKTWEKMSGIPKPNDVSGYIYNRFLPHYFGGRCEAFYTGKFDHKVNVYDINSAYPFAMLDEHPIALTFATYDLLAHADQLTGACMVTVTCKSAGALPFRAPDYSLVFPNDNVEREYHITGWEYLAAVDTGTISDVRAGEFYKFDETINFKGYITHFYNMRKQAKRDGDNANDLFAKLLMNSLYGRFAINPERFNSYMIVDGGVLSEDGTCEEISLGEGLELPFRGDWRFAGQLGSRFLAQQPISEEAKRWHNLATAASITGYVRAMVWRAICASEGVLYCDTDSMVCKSSGVPQGGELGQWKWEGDFKRGAIAGKKMYALEYTHDYYQSALARAKPGEGVPRHKIATKGARLDFDQVMTVASGEVVYYTPQVPTFSVHHEPRFTTRRIKRTDKKELL